MLHVQVNSEQINIYRNEEWVVEVDSEQDNIFNFTLYQSVLNFFFIQLSQSLDISLTKQRVTSFEFIIWMGR